MGNEILVTWLALPWLQDESVVWLRCDMLWVCVEHDDLAEVTIEVAKVLLGVMRGSLHSVDTPTLTVLPSLYLVDSLKSL